MSIFATRPVLNPSGPYSNDNMPRLQVTACPDGSRMMKAQLDDSFETDESFGSDFSFASSSTAYSTDGESDSGSTRSSVLLTPPVKAVSTLTDLLVPHVGPKRKRSTTHISSIPTAFLEYELEQSRFISAHSGSSARPISGRGRVSIMLPSGVAVTPQPTIKQGKKQGLGTLMKGLNFGGDEMKKGMREGEKQIGNDGKGEDEEDGEDEDDVDEEEVGYGGRVGMDASDDEEEEDEDEDYDSEDDDLILII